MKKEKLIVLEWKIEDTRENHPGYRIGTSKLQVKVKNNIEAMNQAIWFAENLPSWELERNGIDENDYREYPICRYYYKTTLARIVKIENVK